MAKGQIKQKQSKINKILFENLCSIQCTKEEICSVLDVSEKTLNSWCKSEYGENFSLVFRKKREKGKSSLRRTQWKLAEKNSTMAIWLGKQYLNQRDHFENEFNFNDVNNNILNLANLINNPQPERKEEDIE